MLSTAKLPWFDDCRSRKRRIVQHTACSEVPGRLTQLVTIHKIHGILQNKQEKVFLIKVEYNKRKDLA